MVKGSCRSALSLKLLSPNVSIGGSVMASSGFLTEALWNRRVAEKNGHPQLKRMPVRDAIASPLNICFAIVPASQQRRFSFDSISLCRRDSESALGKSFLLSTRLSELAPSGAWVEGLIQAARCRTKMPDRIVGARLWRAIFARWTVLSCHELPPCLGRASTGAHRCHSSGP